MQHSIDGQVDADTRNAAPVRFHCIHWSGKVHGCVVLHVTCAGLEQAFWSSKYATVVGGTLSPGPSWPLPAVFKPHVGCAIAQSRRHVMMV